MICYFFDFSGGVLKPPVDLEKYHQSFGQLLSLHISITYQVKLN